MNLLVRALIISITFLAGFLLLDAAVIKKIRHKKIYSFLIELAYFLVFWAVIYVYF